MTPIICIHLHGIAWPITDYNLYCINIWDKIPLHMIESSLCHHSSSCWPCWRFSSSTEEEIHSSQGLWCARGSGIRWRLRCLLRGTWSDDTFSQPLEVWFCQVFRRKMHSSFVKRTGGAVLLVFCGEGLLYNKIVHLTLGTFKLTYCPIP